MNKDFLFIRNMRIQCCLGTTPEERASPQEILISLKIVTPLTEAGATDDLRLTVDYAEIHAELSALLVMRKFSLIEAVAETIATSVLKKPRISAVGVQVSKNPFPGTDAVGASIYREQ